VQINYILLIFFVNNFYNIKEFKYVILKSRVSRTTGAKRRATGEIDIVAEFFVRKITGT